ncbi:class I SAM-dependent methyltransferase [uncultured Jatrophihabitans sp.]|uniref:class I SAM-dependent methyltransferase n=1 Tax=uncultured Jatrophihabitans sp. TaxID=1610747 RepID=UPI0035CBF6F8
MPTLTEARHWLDRWDRQQEFYVADREERFAVIADVVAASADGVEPVVVDLGCGPGSLSVRLLDRLPGARVVAVDADPLLLGLARVAYADRPGLQIVEHDLRDAGWADAVGVRPGTVDAIVSTTALHWLTRTELSALYRSCADLLRPGGVLIDGDHLDEPADRPRLRTLTRSVRDARAARVRTGDAEDWRSWWDAVAAAPELEQFATERGVRPIEHAVPDTPTVADHGALLHAAGFAEVGTVWQVGDDRVLVGVR